MAYLDSYADALKPRLTEDYTFKQYGQQPAQAMSQQSYSLGNDYSMPQVSAGSSGGELASSAAPATASAMSGGDPTMAAIQASGSLLSGYMAQKAADERAKRQAKVDIAQQQAQGETNALRFLDNVYRGALR